MKLRYIAIFALAVALVLGMSIAPASAYFTDTHTANGGVPIQLGPDTEIYEWVKEDTKSVHIKNKDDSVPVYVRVKSDYPATMLTESVRATDDWELAEDGWYVYKHALAVGAETSSIDFTYKYAPEQTDTKLPPEEGENYKVVILYEYAPVNVAPLPDWAPGAKGGN